MKQKLLLLIAFLLFIFDFVSKKIIVNKIIYNKNIAIIKKFFYINYVKNKGVAFSFLYGSRLLIIIITIIILIYLYNYLKDRRLNNIEMIGYGLIIGGAFGNLFDRLIYGYVIDFLDFYVFGYDFPVFNIADCGIVVGVILLIIHSFLYESRGSNGDKGRR